MMDSRDITMLDVHLKLPLAILEIVVQTRPIDDIQHYSLHSALSDMKPDSALLSIASCAQKITRILPGTELLAMEAERILNVYGPLWLQHAKSEQVNDAVVIEQLADLTEDLDGLADLLHTAMGELEEGQALYELLNILYVQANAHSLIAEEFLELLSPKQGRYDLEELVIAGEMGSNVIAFPVQH